MLSHYSSTEWEGGEGGACLSFKFRPIGGALIRRFMKCAGICFVDCSISYIARLQPSKRAIYDMLDICTKTYYDFEF